MGVMGGESERDEERPRWSKGPPGAPRVLEASPAHTLACLECRTHPHTYVCKLGAVATLESTATFPVTRFPFVWSVLSGEKTAVLKAHFETKNLIRASTHNPL